MKMMPIRFVDTYNRKPFFDGPIKDAAGNWVYDRSVICAPSLWDYGAMVVFSILDNFGNGMNLSVPAENAPCLLRYEKCFYDKDCPEQAILIQNLASSDLRGRVAEETANHLYWKLFLFSEAMKIWLPKVVEYDRRFLEGAEQ